MRITSKQFKEEVFCLRLQNSAQRDLWEIHQRGPGGHHGALRSREVHPHEYSGRVQVGPALLSDVVNVDFNGTLRRRSDPERKVIHL